MKERDDFDECRIFCLDTFMGDCVGLSMSNKSTLDLFKKSISKEGIEDIVVTIVGKSELSIDKLKEFNIEFDVLFIDGDHQYEKVKSDYENYRGFVKEGGLIMFHDYKMDADVTRFISESKFKRKAGKHTIFVMEKNNEN